MVPGNHPHYRTMGSLLLEETPPKIPVDPLTLEDADWAIPQIMTDCSVKGWAYVGGLRRNGQTSKDIDLCIPLKGNSLESIVMAGCSVQRRLDFPVEIWIPREQSYDVIHFDGSPWTVKEFPGIEVLNLELGKLLKSYFSEG